MAKKKQIFIDVVVDDKGTTQRLAVDSGKLEKALIKTNKGTLDTQRQMRGAASMSSNLTKNFSKYKIKKYKVKSALTYENINEIVINARN